MSRHRERSRHAREARRATPAWTPLVEGDFQPEDRAMLERLGQGDSRVYLNSRYQVVVRAVRHPLEQKLGRCIHLSIKRRDKEPIHDWRDLQRIKNELAGPEAEAIEIYPAESRLIDEANQYHLWAYPDLPAGTFLPIGWHGRRIVGSPEEAAAGGGKQRAWESA